VGFEPTVHETRQFSRLVP